MVSLIIGATAINLYAILLVIARAKVYRTPLYRPMLWNIWLSVLPILVLLVALAAWFVLLPISRGASFAALAVIGVVWLLLLPNASYLITELNQSHRAEDDPVPLWFDIILVISLAMSGVVNTVVNVFVAHTIATIMMYEDSAANFLRPSVLITVGIILLLLAFGMYLGRYPRFNSWDIKHPRAFIRKLGEHFSDRENVAACLGFTVTYAVFLALIYLVAAGPVIEGLLRIERLRSGG